MKTNSQIRAAARAQLGGHIFAEGWLNALLLCAGVSIVLSFASSFLIGIALYGPAAFSLSYIFMGMARGKTKIDYMDMKQGFLNGQFVRSFLLGLLQGLFVFLWSLLLVIPGIIKSYSYRMAFYIAADHPEYSPTECLKASCEMMNGHKLRAFCMDVVMALWSLAGSCVCGIGAFFVMPYQEASFANLYEEIKNASTAA